MHAIRMNGFEPLGKTQTLIFQMGEMSSRGNKFLPPESDSQ